MRSHQARAKLIGHIPSKSMVEHLVTGALSSQERRYIEQMLPGQNRKTFYALLDLPIILATGTRGRVHFVYGTYPLKILNAANTFYAEILERFPGEETQILVQRRLRAMTDRLSELPNQNMTEHDEEDYVQTEYTELVKLASFLVQHDLRPLGDFQATSTLLGW